MLIGQTIGNYLVTQKLGEGGMGSVYLAEHPSIGKKVALKVLHAEFSSNREVIERFFNEAKAVNDIGHPNIVDIIDYGVLQAGQTPLVYFIMEYLGGQTLSQVIRGESPIAPERALGIALQIADALAASHKCGIVHRDLKPDNIMLAQRARQADFVKLLDFGIAKLSSSSANGSQHRTRTGIVMGTPAYMSPEQCEGRASVDHRTDIYALGVVLYEMLTGRVPFIGEGYGEILVQHLTQMPVPPSQYRMMPPHVEIVVLKALEKRSDLRFPTMDEFMRAMADPVGYVEANGGIGGFLQRPLTPSSAPLPMRMTPAPGMGMGMGMPGLTPIPGSMTYTTPTPTTLGQATGVNTMPPKRGKGVFVVAGIAVVAVAAIAIAVVLGAKGGGTTVAATDGSGSGSGSATVTQPTVAITNPGSGSAMTVKQPETPKNPETPKIPETGSAATGGSGSGSAAIAAMTSMQLTLETEPKGAKVLVNGMDIGQTSDVTIPIIRTKHKEKAMITLQLHGYADERFEVDPEESDTKTVTRTLRKVAVVRNPPGGTGTPPGKGSGTPGKGSNTGHTETGTGLMKPGD